MTSLASGLAVLATATLVAFIAPAAASVGAPNQTAAPAESPAPPLFMADASADALKQCDTWRADIAGRIVLLQELSAKIEFYKEQHLKQEADTTDKVKQYGKKLNDEVIAVETQMMSMHENNCPDIPRM